MKKLGAILWLSGAVCLASTPVPDGRLADAVERGDRASLVELLEQGADINARQPDGMTALHWAAWRDDLEAARRLVRAGADVKAENRYQVTPLRLACLNGNGEMVRLLLEAGADPNTTAPGGETVLMTAARTGKPEAVRALIEAGADLNARERRGQTAIMWAAAEGHAEAVKLLIEAGADYSITLESGFNAFLFAVREGRAEVVRLFLGAGVDVNTPMEPRHSGGRNVRKGTSALLLAVENGHFEMALELVESGADPNDIRSGFTPLHALTWVRKPVFGEDADGEPPPVGTGEVNSLDFARELVKRGADVHVRLKRGKAGRAALNLDGATPFLMAAQTADLEYMRLLLEFGADPLLPNSEGCTPLMAAAGIGILAPGEEAATHEESIEAMKFLLALGADINTVDDNGETAMHGAAYKIAPKLVRFLAESGADIAIWNRPNKYGWTPLRIAQGYRPGNFRPSAATIAAIENLLLAAGVAPPTDEPPQKNLAY